MTIFGIRKRRSQPSPEAVADKVEREKSAELLAHVKGMTPYIDDTVRKLVEYKERNHFGEAIQLSYGIKE
jgi:hypothetical protein